MARKLDLLVRVRFENPIPDPPFPPKLLNVSTNVARLGEPSYLDQLASSAPFQLLPDAEMGMPIDLNKFEGVWDGDDSALNPTLDPARVTDAADLELLTPLRIVGAMNGVAGAPAGSSAPKPEVSWMRNTTYMQKKDAAVRRRALAEKRAEEVDASEATQIMAIDKTFIDLTAQPVEEIRHPDAKRKHLRVVETYDILPDDDAWSNSYIMIKFPERPSAATAANPGAIASRGRLDRAVLRPVMEDDQQVMEYFLPKEDDLDRLGEIEQVPLGEESMEKLREFQAEGGGREQGENIDEIMPVSALMLLWLTAECCVRQDTHIRGGHAGAASEGDSAHVCGGRERGRGRHVWRRGSGRAGEEETQGCLLQGHYHADAASQNTSKRSWTGGGGSLRSLGQGSGRFP